MFGTGNLGNQWFYYTYQKKRVFLIKLPINLNVSRRHVACYKELVFPYNLVGGI